MLKNLIIVLTILLMSCRVQEVKTKEKDSIEYNGIGCGSIHSEYGDIRLFSEIDSSTYLLIVLENKSTTVESGEMILESNDSTNQVFLLDFNTDKKVYETIVEGVTGYVFPCSDIVSNSHVPDTLTLLEGKLEFKIQTIIPNNERIYYIHLENAKFYKGNKIKVIKKQIFNIKFTKGEPG